MITQACRCVAIALSLAGCSGGLGGGGYGFSSIIRWSGRAASRSATARWR